MDAFAGSAGSVWLGCMLFGTRVPEDRAFAILDRYVERGGVALDTANNYAYWQPGGTGDESELLLGRWLRSRGCREDVVLATKVGARPAAADGPEGLSDAVVREGIDASLARLGVDAVDLYYAHIDDRRVAQEETLRAFDALVRSGKVRTAGASNLRSWRLALARAISRREDLTAFACIQQRFSYLQPAPGADFGAQIVVDDDLLDFCRTEDVPILAYSPLLGGAYARPAAELEPAYRTAANARRHAVAEEVAREAGATPNQVVLAWLRQASGARVIPVIAVSSVEQLEENLDGVELELSREHLDALDAAHA